MAEPAQDVPQEAATQPQGAPGAENAPTPASEAERLFGAPAQPQGVPGGNGEISPMPEGLIEKYWTGDMEAYARAVTQGYQHLNGQYTQATQQLGGDDRPGEVVEAYWAERTQAALEAQYGKLDFADMEGVRDVYRAAHAQGLGPKRANALVDDYLARRNASAPEVEADEDRRSRVVHALGPQGAKMAAAVAAWVQGGGFTAEEVAAMAPLADSADGVRVLFKLSRASLSAPPAGDGLSGGVEAQRAREVAEVKAGLADPRKLADPAFIARYRALVKDGYTLDGRPVPVEG